MSKENIYRTAVYVTAFSVAEKFFGFLYRIILSRTLGSEGMGIYQIALSVFAVLITATSSGLPLAVSRLITKHRTNGNRKAEHSTVSAAVIIAASFSLPVFFIMFFANHLFSFLFADSRCMAVLVILLPGLTFNSIYSVLRGVLWGNKKFIPYCVIDLIEELVMIATGTALVAGMTSVIDGAKRVALAVVLSYLVSFSLATIYFFVKGGHLKNPKNAFKPLLATALPVTGMRTSASLINSAISLLLPIRLAAVGFSAEQAMSDIGVMMGMSMPVLSIPATLIGSLSLVMVPELSEFYFRKQYKKLADNIEKAIKITTLIACVLIPMLFVLGEDLGIILFGNEMSGRAIMLCCPMLLPMSLNMITTGILNSLGCEKQTCGFFFVGAVATLACTWFLPSVLGVYAQTAGIAASSLVCCILNIRLILKKNKEKVRFFKHTFICTISIFPVILFGKLLHDLFNNFMPLFPAAIATATILLAANALFLFAIGLAEPKWVRILLKKPQ